MFNNLNNFFNLLKSGRYKTVLQDEDVIPIGVYDKRYEGNYKPAFTKWSDIKPGFIPVDTNTWDMPNTAFVATDGNNATAVVGDGNKPYLTINTALANANYVIILPGNYSQSFGPSVANKNIYCFPGVVFTSGGLSVTSSAVNMDGFRFTGHASFEGNSSVNLRPASMNGAIIEIDRYTGTGANGIFIQPQTTRSVVDIRIGYADFPTNASSAPNISFRGHLAGNIDIAYAAGCYKVINLRDNRQDININVGTLITKNLGNLGNSSGFKNGMVIELTGVSGIRYNVNIGVLINQCATTLADGCFQVNNLSADSSVNAKIGYAYSTNNPLVYLINNNASSSVNVEITGKTLYKALLSYNNGNTSINNSLFVQALRSQIQAGTTCISNTSFYNTGVEDTIYSNTNTGKLIMNNVGSQGDPVAYVYNGVLGCTYGFNNVISNQAVEGVNPVNDYTATGLVVEANYLAPKI